MRYIFIFKAWTEGVSWKFSSAPLVGTLPSRLIPPLWIDGHPFPVTVLHSTALDFLSTSSCSFGAAPPSLIIPLHVFLLGSLY